MTGHLPTTPSPEPLEDLGLQVRRALDAALPAGARVALLDFPWNANVGNHLMWLGAMRYLRSSGRHIVYVADAKNYRPDVLRAAIGEGPILLNGGAGMGALWPDTIGLKQRVIRDFPRNPVVILPQTVHFRDRHEGQRYREIFSRHERLVVLARDHRSYATARDALPRAEIALAPDLALLLPPQTRSGLPERETIWLTRNDIEAADFERTLDGGRFDWAEQQMTDFRAAYATLRLGGVFSRVRNRAKRGGVAAIGNSAVVWFYERVANLMLAAGNRSLDRGRVLLTERLHGHLLAVLRQQPTVLLPDAYGKNRAIFESWTSRFSNVLWADTPGEALQLVASGRL